MIERISKKCYFVLLVISWLLFAISYFDVGRKSEVIQPEPRSQSTLSCVEKYEYGDLSDFSYSPDMKYIAFVESVFGETGNYDTSWAVKIMDVSNREEKTLLITDSHLHDYDWISTSTIRVVESGGTGVQAFRDVSVNLIKPDVFKEYIDAGRAAEFFTPDEAYATKSRNSQLAREFYYGR